MFYAAVAVSNGFTWVIKSLVNTIRLGFGLIDYPSQQAMGLQGVPSLSYNEPIISELHAL